MDQPARLLAHRRDHARMAVAEVRDRDPAEEVEVLVALGVPQARALAAHELDGQARVGGVRCSRSSSLQLGERSRAASIFVPMPSSVNSSSNSECGTRPSTMCAAPTPPWIASTQAASFGRMPPSSAGRPSSTSSALGLADQAAGVVRIAQPAGHVGQEDHLVRAERVRDRAGGLVGVDVVRLPSRSAPTEAITGM